MDMIANMINTETTLESVLKKESDFESFQDEFIDYWNHLFGE